MLLVHLCEASSDLCRTKNEKKKKMLPSVSQNRCIVPGV